MAKNTKAKDPAALSRDELLEVLLWLFTSTGYSQHVDAYRRRNDPPACPPGDSNVMKP